jgi:hypothetical protein
MDNSAIEMNSNKNLNWVEGNFDPAVDAASLPKPDEGKDAWLFLSACFMMEALVWGFPFAFGLFQEYYSTHEPFASSSNIAVIGTCAMVRFSPKSTKRLGNDWVFIRGLCISQRHSSLEHSRDGQI